MEDSFLVTQLYSIMYYAAIIAAPPLILATLFGFIVSVLQAITQIQDQSLPQTVKIVAISLILMFWGSVLSAPFLRVSELLFTDFPKWVS